MKIVINLDEYQLEHCKRHVKERYSNMLEEAIAKGTPLDKVLDKIRAEIDELDGKYAIGDYAIYGEHSPKYVQLVEVLRIIDKYKESEDT